VRTAERRQWHAGTAWQLVDDNSSEWSLLRLMCRYLSTRGWGGGGSCTPTFFKWYMVFTVLTPPPLQCIDLGLNVYWRPAYFQLLNFYWITLVGASLIFVILSVHTLVPFICLIVTTVLNRRYSHELRIIIFGSSAVDLTDHYCSLPRRRPAKTNKVPSLMVDALTLRPSTRRILIHALQSADLSSIYEY